MGMAFCDRLPSAISCGGSSEKTEETLSMAPIIDLVAAERAEAVKTAFRDSFTSYWKSCKGHDEIRPVTGGCKDPRNGWGASAIDGLSTAIIMELDSVVVDILEYVPTIDFTKTETFVSLFETTIRYLGGLLSAYDLLQDAPFFQEISLENHRTLLDQSRNLANALKFAFDTPTGIPHNDLYINGTWLEIKTNGLATTGTLILEWQRLSDLTGDPRYGELAAKAESYLLDPVPAWNVPFPGLPGTRISIDKGVFVDANGGWNGGDDSYYEYLIKSFVYDPIRFSSYRDAWIEAANSTIKHLASHPSTRPDLTFLAAYRNHTLVPEGTHLGCFAGGNFLLAGQVTGSQKYIDFGLAITDGCHETYAATATGIGPEDFSWNDTKISSEHQNSYDRHGFWVKNPVYQLRPEVIESYYYAYRITGDKKYQDWAWDAFVAINKTCRFEHGFSTITDVTEVHGGGNRDSQESFLFSEVMKYSFMIQAGEAPWQVNFEGSNEFVYNTEGHPVRVARPWRGEREIE